MIKTLKRMAFGYRDSAYFFMKIKSRFPRQSVKNFLRSGRLNA